MNLQKIVEDPPDSNVYEIAEIEYKSIEPLEENLTRFEHLQDLHDLFATQSIIEDITKAIRISNERYMYAIMHGIYDAAELQANTIKEYTILQTNYYNIYTSWPIIINEAYPSY